jgi:hypothetical protein
MAQDLTIRYHGTRDTRRQRAPKQNSIVDGHLENKTVRPVVAGSGDPPL